MQLTFILWTLSFNDDAIEKFAITGVLDLLIQQVSAAPREKVVRVALETLQVRVHVLFLELSTTCRLTDSLGYACADAS